MYVYPTVRRSWGVAWATPQVWACSAPPQCYQQCHQPCLYQPCYPVIQQQQYAVVSQRRYIEERPMQQAHIQARRTERLTDRNRKRPASARASAVRVGGGFKIFPDGEEADTDLFYGTNLYDRESQWRSPVLSAPDQSPGTEPGGRRLSSSHSSLASGCQTSTSHGTRHGSSHCRSGRARRYTDFSGGSRMSGDDGHEYEDEQEYLELSPPGHERRYYDAYEVEPGIRVYRAGSSGPRGW